MADAIENEIATAGGIAVIACIVAVVALVVAIGSGKESSTVDGVSGFDLRLAVDSCTPYKATFEQELACYQAVYGYKLAAKD